MATIFDVSDAILRHFPYGISTRKLQKLAYYTQGWTLGLRGTPLFGEDFEAWTHGPVCRELYNQHRGMYSIQRGILKGSASNLTDIGLQLVDTIVSIYGRLSGDELSELTHKPGSPWADTRKAENTNDGQASTTVISKDSMRRYFRHLYDTGRL